MRRLALTAFAAILFAAPLAADAVRLVSPRSGTILRGGSVATVEWTAASLPAGAEEWEAFLSIDGGRYYPFRITPHVDVELRRFDFIVPNVDTAHARLMLHLGNEKSEEEFELPASFSIERDSRAELPLAQAEPSRSAEAAREGDPPVVAWAEGDRAGTRVANRTGASNSPLELAAAAGEEPASSLDIPPETIRGAASARVVAPAGRTRRRAAIYQAEQSPPDDLLLVCRRRNI